MGPRVSHWQVTLMSAGGQSMIFGLDAPDKEAAFRTALERAPGHWPVPVTVTLLPLPPLCAAHRVRHACGDSASETPVFE